jgi:crossover junction endodeoxyribonuclease RuvC
VSITVGVDPGKSGAIALIHSDGTLVAVYDMPLAGSIVSAQLLADLEFWSDGRHGTVVIEDVHSMPKQGVASSFSFGRSLGVVEGVFAGAGRPLVYVSPAKWKRALGLTSDKGMSRRRAIETWPTKAHLFKRVKDEGRAEAALIALWHVQSRAEPSRAEPSRAEPSRAAPTAS